MFELPKSFTELDGYEEEMRAAKEYDADKGHLFFRRFFKNELLGLEIKDLTMKDWIVMSETNHPILNENYELSDCIKLLYNLTYKPTNSILLRIYREYKITKTVCKHIIKHYPNEDIETKIKETCKNYLDEITSDLPGKYNIGNFEPSQHDKANLGIQDQGESFYVYAVLFGKMMEKFGFSENDLLDMPVAVFYQYYNVLRRMENPEYKPDNKCDYVKRKYLLKHIKLKKILNEKKD